MEHAFEDARVYRTKRDIKTTFINLLLERKDLNKIHVKEITKLSHYNRSTFYAHFIDKHDLLNQIMEELLHGFKMSFKESYPKDRSYSIDKMSKTAIQFFGYILRERQLFSFLFLNSKTFGFKDRLLDVLEKDLLTELVFPEIEVRNVDKNLFLKMKAHMIFSHISFWIEQDFEHSIDYMNEQLLNNLTFMPNRVELSRKFRLNDRIKHKI